MSITPQNPQTGDESSYAPNWISIDDFLPGDLELPNNDDDLYPEIDPDDNPDYINQEKMRH